MTTQSDTPVQLAVENGVALLTLNRPMVLNAVDIALAEALDAAVCRIEQAGEARAILLMGAGRAFCAGGDVSKFDGREPHATVAARTIAAFHPAILNLASSRLPTIAAVHGAVAGAGISLMLACDFVVAASNTRFTLAYPKIGATIDGGASWFLPRLVGLRKAKELALLSETIDSATALTLGLLNRVVELGALPNVARSFASQIAAGPTAAFGAIKNRHCPGSLNKLGL